jgi:hypothetical protein
MCVFLDTAPYEKIKSEARFIEKIAMLIPGYRGYKLKELRREADKLVRNYLYQQLTLSKNDLKTVYQRLVDNKLTDVWTDLDRLLTVFDMVSREINYASYGYSGFFDAVKIQEDNLDAMLAYDTKLIDNVKRVDLKVKQFKEEVENGEFTNTRVHIKAIRSDVDIIDKLYHERKNVVLGV